MNLPKILGWPGAVNGDGVPSEFEMDKHILRTMPIAYIAPCHQKFQMGLEVYNLVSAWTEPNGRTPSYSDYLKQLNVNVGDTGVSLGGFGPYLPVMYNDINPLGESYSNSFAASSHADQINNAVPQDIQDVMFIANGNTKQLTEAAMDKGGFLGGAAAGAKDIAETAQNAVRAVAGNKVAKGASELSRAGKIDFPMMWRSSNWNAEYNFSVRLYCPSPSNDTLYETLIVAPYAAITALALPKTVGSDSFSYQWPFLVQLFIPGIVNLRAGYVSSLSVLKGGDVNDRSWIGRPNIIDIRINVSPLYSTALLPYTEPDSGQPTLLNEIQALRTVSRTIVAGDVGGYIDEEIGVIGPSVGPVSSPADTNTTPVSGPTEAQSEAGSAFGGAGSG